MESFENPTPVDLERLRDISDDDLDMMNEFVTIYLHQTREFLASLENDIAAGDFEAVRKTAHKALGGSSTCGMNAVLPFFKELERQGENRDLTGAETNLAQAKDNFNLIQTFLLENTELKLES